MEEQTQYDTMKKIYEEGQISGAPTITAEKEEPKAEEEKTLKSDTRLTKEVTPRFEGGFGELMGVKEFGQLNRDVEVLGMNIDALQKSLDTITDKDELQYQTKRLDTLQRDLYDKNQKLKNEKEKRQEITDKYNKLQKQKQEEQLQQIKEGKDTRQTYDKPRTQQQRQDETGQTQKQRESRTATTGKFERAKAGASVSGQRIRGGI
jgi:chromosome segregation ATPase